MPLINRSETNRIAADETGREETVRIQDLSPNNPIVKTHNAGPNAIGATDLPTGERGIANGKVTLPPASSLLVENAATGAGIGAPQQTTDFAFAVIKMALNRENYGSEKLKMLSGQVKEMLADIDLLLDLSGELTALPDKESHEITQKMKGLIGKLEAHKIQVWKGENKITKEKLSEMKAQISSQIDKLRTSLQTKISTEIQPEANNLQAIMNIVQQIIQSDARLKRKTSEVPR